MNVAIFGGTFDPVHRGHLAVARAAQRACKLDRIYFVPADIPPHKQRQPITAFEHRYAMLALALRGEPTFVPSLMESGRESSISSRRKPNYSIDTVRRFKKTLGKTDRLFFIVGIDMFETIDTWHKPEKLMREVDFIVVSRPGYADFDGTYVETGRRRRSADSPPRARRNTKETIRIHWVTDVSEDVSSTNVRALLAKGQVGKGLLDPAVLDYIQKEHLYLGDR